MDVLIFLITIAILSALSFAVIKIAKADKKRILGFEIEALININDFLEISVNGGIYTARIKDMGSIKNITFGGLSFNETETIFSSNTAVVFIKSQKDKIYKWISPAEGVLKRYGKFDYYGQIYEINIEEPIFELDTSRAGVADFKLKQDLARKAEQIERERREIADKLKERERRRKLEKEVMQELIDKGDIMPAAGRAPIPREVVDAVFTRDGGKCVYCGSTKNLQIDHIIPFSKGGSDALENLQILCQKCNIEKSNKIG